MNSLLSTTLQRYDIRKAKSSIRAGFSDFSFFYFLILPFCFCPITSILISNSQKLEKNGIGQKQNGRIKKIKKKKSRKNRPEYLTSPFGYRIFAG